MVQGKNIPGRASTNVGGRTRFEVFTELEAGQGDWSTMSGRKVEVKWEYEAGGGSHRALETMTKGLESIV